MLLKPSGFSDFKKDLLYHLHVSSESFTQAFTAGFNKTL